MFIAAQSEGEQVTIRSKPRVCFTTPALIAVVLLLKACSVAEISYNNGDWLAAHMADEYMDLDGKQEAALRARVVEALERNRSRDLPLYEAFLENVRGTVESGIAIEDARSTLQAATLLYERLARDLAKLVAPTLSSLSEEQINHLEQTLIERSQELEEKYLQDDYSVRLQARAQRTVDYLEGWTGSLSARQEEIVKDRSRVLPYTINAWLEYRTLQSARLVELLRQQAESETIRVFLVGWWVDQEGKPREAIRNDNAYLDGVLRMISRLDQTLTPRQRSRATERLQDWIDVLKALQDTAPPLPTARSKHRSSRTG